MARYFALALLALGGASEAEASLSGIGRAIDGDSLMVGEKEVRLFGVDAPEFNQTCKRGGLNWACGAEAASRLAKLVTGKDVRCVAVGTDQHERILARCTVGTTDVNRTMVTLGFAVAYRRYSFDYVSAEETAKANRRGIWAGTFEMPSAYRHEEPQTVRAPSAGREKPIRSKPVRSSLAPVDSGGCLIKGNQGSNGWIYHLPGMPYYNQTRAEQMFCSEADARAAGYRRAKVR